MSKITYRLQDLLITALPCETLFQEDIQTAERVCLCVASRVQHGLAQGFQPIDADEDVGEFGIDQEGLQPKYGVFL
jgi:hypothetical protein